MAQRSLAKHAWYEFLRVVCRTVGTVVFGIRVFGQRHIPQRGPVLLVSNHQSHLDPVLIGLACDRRLNFVARKTLFGFAPFRWLIKSLDAIPIDREGSGLGGLKESLKRLKAGEVLAIFPEGTRTCDGKVAALKPGFVALARRSSATILPAAITGAYDSWPRRNLLPRPATIHIQFGQPATAEEVAGWTDEMLLAEIGRRIQAVYLEAENRRKLALGVGQVVDSKLNPANNLGIFPNPANLSYDKAS